MSCCWWIKTTKCNRKCSFIFTAGGPSCAGVFVLPVVVLVFFEQMFVISSFLCQSVEDLADQLSVSYYKTSSSLLCLRNKLTIFIPSTVPVSFESETCCLLCPAQTLLKIGRNSSLLTQSFNYFFRVRQYN